jgi:hypothetical protein
LKILKNTSERRRKATQFMGTLMSEQNKNFWTRKFRTLVNC